MPCMHLAECMAALGHMLEGTERECRVDLHQAADLLRLDYHRLANLTAVTLSKRAVR